MYYDSNNTGQDGTQIASGIGIGTTNHNWDTSGIPEGNYYIYAIIDDGNGGSASDYSDGTVNISHTPPPASSQTIYSDGSWSNAVVCTYSPPTNPISGAQWIWQSGWPGSCTVSKTINIDGSISSASINIAVDNYYILYINGSEVGRKDSDPSWTRVDTFDIRSYLHDGSNTVSVNGWNEYNQVGISVKIQIN